MAQETIVMPSGFAGVVRGLKAKEMSSLADGKATLKAGGHPLDPVYAGCWLETTDVGPYAGYGVEIGKPVNWSHILMCDRFWAFLRIRACTWGDGYEFKVRCPNTDCVRHKKAFVWDIPLSKLEFKKLPDASIAKVKAKDLIFPFQLGGTNATFKLLQGKDEAGIGKIEDDTPGDKKLLAQAASRLVTVEGVKPDELIEWIGNLDWPDLVAMSKAFDDVDGGVETRTQIACPECETEWSSDVPFDVQSFLLRKA